MKNTRLFVLALTSLLLLACGGVPQTYYYRVDHAEGQTQNNHTSSVPYIIGVSQFSADALYESDRIVYRDSPYEAQFYNYRRWIAAPKKIVTENVLKQYQSSGVFRRVVRIPSALKIDYILQGSIYAFEEWDQENEWFGLVTVNFMLQDAATDEILWEKQLSHRTSADRKDPVAVVQAISESLNTVVANSISEISNHLRGSSN